MVLSTEAAEFRHYGLHALAGHEYAGLGFEDCGDVGAGLDLGVAAAKRLGIEVLKFDSQRAESLAVVVEAGIILVGHPERADGMKEVGLVGGGDEVPPEGERADGEASVEEVLAVAGADDAGLAAGTGAGIGGAVLVQERYVVAGLLEKVCSPRSEGPRADHSDALGGDGGGEGKQRSGGLAAGEHGG